MEALKLVALIMLGFLGFGILTGIAMAAKAVGFVLGFILFGILLGGLLIYWVIHSVKKPKE